MTQQRRRGRTILLAVVGTGVIAAAVWAALPRASDIVSAFSFKADRAQFAWRSIDPTFGNAKNCGKCHDTELTRLTSAKHGNIGCQSCHGGQAEHEYSPEGGTRTPDDSICLTCHITSQGQPDSFLTIVPKDHYTSSCLACHDPHTGISNRPPVVSHKTTGLPACVTCHGPDGFKQQSIRHPDTSSTDKFCLSCHLPGRGPEVEVENA